MLKKRTCPLTLGVTTASQTMANDQKAVEGFVEDSHLDLFFRNDYTNCDYKHGRQDRAEQGQAATATSTSGFAQRTVGIGVGTSGLYAVCLDGDRGCNDVASIDFFRQGDNSSAADDLFKGDAAVKFRISNVVLKYGDQILSLPVLSYDNSCLLPESYSDTLITSKETEDLELNAGRFAAESRKSAEGRDSGDLRSISVFGDKYTFTDHFNASLYASDVEDVLKEQYINLSYTIPLQADQSLNSDFDGYRIKLDSDFTDQNFNGNRDNKIWSLATPCTTDIHTFMVAHQRNAGDTGYNCGWYQNAGGIGGGGITIWLIDSYWSDFNAEGERSWQVSYALDFAKYGISGLTYHVAYVRGDNIKTAEISNDGEREIFNQAQYVVRSGPARGFTLRLRSSFLCVSNGTRSCNDDGNEIRAFAEYPFNVF